MRILGTATSPYTRKLLFFALEKNLPVEFVVDSPLAGLKAWPSFRAMLVRA